MRMTVKLSHVIESIAKLWLSREATKAHPGAVILAGIAYQHAM
jgi:hypothetical protein